MTITELNATAYRLQADGFDGRVEVAAGPAFYGVTAGGLTLPDWKSDDAWLFPQVEGAPLDAFQGARCAREPARVSLTAAYSGFGGAARAALHWEADREHDALECFWEIENRMDRPVAVDNVWPFQFRAYMPYRPLVAAYLTGTGERYALEHSQFGREYVPCRTALAPNVTVRLDEISGASSETQHPWLFLTWPDDAFTMILAIAWSGNWLMEASNTFERVRVKAGIGFPDSPVTIQPGATERLPSVFVFCSAGGIETAANAMHRFIRARLLPPGRRESGGGYPTLTHVNYFGVRDPDAGTTREQLLRAAQTARDLGHEFFDMSIHWFTEKSEQWKYANWFDWTQLERPAASVFPPPGGLEAFCDELRDMGLKVAVWVEPERVSLHGGQVFRDRFPDGLWLPSGEGSADGLADLGRDEIADWIFEKLDALVSRYKLDGLFYDHNFFHKRAPSYRAPKTMYRYYRNYYRILERLRLRHPRLRLVACASGGRRIDLGMIRFADALQISDCVSDPLLMLQQMWAASLIAPIETIERYAFTLCWPNWTGDALTHNGRFLLRAAMMGAFSSANPYEMLDPPPLALLKEHNLFYRRELAPIIDGADVYRLTEFPRLLPAFQAGGWDKDFARYEDTDSPWFALQEHQPAGDRHACFVFRLRSRQDAFLLKPKALQPARRYEVRNWDQGSAQTLTGLELSEEGLPVALSRDFDSAIVLLRPIAERCA